MKFFRGRTSKWAVDLIDIKNLAKSIIIVTTIHNGIETNIERCASENTRLPRGVDYEIPYQLERGMETSL